MHWLLCYVQNLLLRCVANWGLDSFPILGSKVVILLKVIKAFLPFANSIYLNHPRNTALPCIWLFTFSFEGDY
uniref:Mitochondrial ubiquitin ligase activator of NFKB 1 n=1 Tax=Rhizophora mucronata TaxID=61149 RepID=A0A2P2KU98_RHIMU